MIKASGSDIISSLEHEIERCPDGKFKIYKNVSAQSNSRRYANKRHVLNLKCAKEISRYSSKSDVYFGAFSCLLIRYSQNEVYTGVRLSNFAGNTSVTIINIPVDEKLTFNDVLKMIAEDGAEIQFEQRQLNDILPKVASFINCIFEYTDCQELDDSFDSRMSYTDIYFQISVLNEKVILDITYNKNIYNDDFICRMILHYENLLSNLLANLEMPVISAPYLSTFEEELLVDVWNRTDHQFPKGYCVHQLFEERVAEAHNNIAVYYEGKTMTRGMLNKRANQLAYSLIQQGVKKGDIIALYSNKSIGFVIGIIGILKAGCAYLPIDVSYPQSRIKYILTNSKASHVVSTIDLGINSEIMSGLSVLKITSEGEVASDCPDDNPEVNVSPQDPCYLIYTSGSTGQPKGVLLNHEGRVNNFFDFNSRFSITHNDKVLAVSSVSFDMSAYDVLGSLIAGSSIVLPQPSLEKQPFHWLDLIQKYNVTIWHSVPVLLDLLCKCCRHRETHIVNSIRLVLLGGDWIPVSLPDDFHLMNSQAVIVSLGGATEVSMDSTIYEIDEVNPIWKSIPYGKPMCNQKAYILDKNRQLLPIGIPGELYLGGIGVGEGYYLNSDATRERFFENPWIEGSKERIYKTGDLAYFEPDGTLILLGRIDFQVKINGTRIELGEIEQCLLNFDGIDRVVAIAPKIGATRRIVAHVEVSSGHKILKEGELIEFLTSLLPKSYIPSHIIFTNAIPLTPNGKIDRKTLEQITDDYLKQA